MNSKFNRYLLSLIAAIGLIWLKSGYGKFSSGNFAEGLEKTLAVFAGKNPYPWYKDFLNNIAIPNSTIFGNLTLWGELLSATAILVAVGYLLIKTTNKLILVLLIAGLLGGMFLNIIFWLAAGWMSPSNDSLGLLMIFIQFVGVLYSIKILRS